MKVALINLEFDCAGVSWNLRNALRSIGVDAVHVMRRSTIAAGNTDLKFKDVGEVVGVCRNADVLHFNQWIWTHRPSNKEFEFEPVNEYGSGSPFDGVLKGKRVLFHFHGGSHQLNPDYWLGECQRVGATALKCDPISPLGPALWVPNVLDVAAMAAPPYDPYGEIQVAVMGDLGDPRRNNIHIAECLKYAGIKHTCFGNMLRDVAMKDRAAYQITIDNLTQGFTGMWSLEAMALWQPVIARLDPATVDAYVRLSALPLPYLHAANADWAVWWIKRLTKNRDALIQAARMSVEWLKSAYDPIKIANMYLGLYRRR